MHGKSLQQIMEVGSVYNKDINFFMVHEVFHFHAGSLSGFHEIGVRRPIIRYFAQYIHYQLRSSISLDLFNCCIIIYLSILGIWFLPRNPHLWMWNCIPYLFTLIGAQPLVFAQKVP